MAMYSAALGESATVDCKWLLQNTGPVPRCVTYPVILLPRLGSTAKEASTHVMRAKLLMPLLYLRWQVEVPLRYLRILLTRIHSPLVGADMPEATLPTANEISGLVMVDKYINCPTVFLYSVVWIIPTLLSNIRYT